MGSAWMFVPIALAAVGIFLAMLLAVATVVVFVEDRRRRGAGPRKH